MSKVRCYECKKSYDYDEDGFCPRCGCFNQPPSARRIDANGNIVYLDGINERQLPIGTEELGGDGWN